MSPFVFDGITNCCFDALKDYAGKLSLFTLKYLFLIITRLLRLDLFNIMLAFEKPLTAVEGLNIRDTEGVTAGDTPTFVVLLELVITSPIPAT